jgi:hypothetical protein
VDAILDKGLCLAQQLRGEEDDGGGAVADLGVLRQGNVDKGLCRRVHHIQKLDDGGPVVADGHAAVAVVDQLVHPPRAQRGAHDVR